MQTKKSLNVRVVNVMYNGIFVKGQRTSKENMKILILWLQLQLFIYFPENAGHF